MSLDYNPASNVAVPLFEPGYPDLTVAFDADNRLNIPTYTETGYAPIYRWYVCDTSVGYKYKTLAWVVGSGAPDLPTCCPVEVVRVPV